MRIALGPNRAPGRDETPSSNGAPTIATSAPRRAAPRRRSPREASRTSLASPSSRAGRSSRTRRTRRRRAAPSVPAGSRAHRSSAKLPTHDRHTAPSNGRIARPGRGLGSRTVEPVSRGARRRRLLPSCSRSPCRGSGSSFATRAAPIDTVAVGLPLIGVASALSGAPSPALTTPTLAAAAGVAILAVCAVAVIAPRLPERLPPPDPAIRVVAGQRLGRESDARGGSGVAARAASRRASLRSRCPATRSTRR